MLGAEVIGDAGWWVVWAGAARGPPQRRVVGLMVGEAGAWRVWRL